MKNAKPGRFAAATLAVLAAACGSESPSAPSSDALATALTPKQAPEYYVDQANTLLRAWGALRVV